MNFWGLNKGTLIFCCLFVSLLCFSQVFYLLAKASVAQLLLNNAWQETQSKVQEGAVNTVVKPWPWADVYPVAELTFERLNIQQLVLNNDSGQALAFGPGLSGISRLTEGSNSLSDNQLLVISAHRDSHFKVLARLVIGDIITIKRLTGPIKSYQVTKLSIIDIRNQQLVIPLESENRGQGIILLTCYPFSGLRASTPYRLIVEAS